MGCGHPPNTSSTRGEALLLLILSVALHKWVTQMGNRLSAHTCASQAPRCTSKDTTVTCSGDGTLLPDHVHHSGAFGEYTHAKVEEGITSIGSYAFNKCYKLSTIELPSSIVEYQELAYEGCAFTSFTVGKNVKTLFATSWNSCRSLTHLYVESGSKYYVSKDGFLFNGTSTTGDLLCVGAGRGAGGTLTLPSCETLLVNCLRWNRCTHLVISDTTTAIKEYAFYGCDTMTTITLGKKVSSFDYRAFVFCSSLTSFEINGNSNFYFSNNRFGLKDSTGQRSILWVADSVTSFQIPSTVTAIGQAALQVRSQLVTVTVASGNTNYKVVCNNQVIIDKQDGSWKRARFCVGGATSITIPSSVTTIQTACFRDCRLLTQITFHNGNINCLNGILRGCSNLTMIDFKNCAITNIDGAKQIPNNLARSCTNLVTVSNWPTHEFVIGECSFHGCGFTSLTLPSQCTKILRYAFQECRELTALTISNKITSIESYAFYGCSKLETITFASVSVLKTIESWAFSACSSLEAITLPSTITTLSISVFASDPNLKSINFNDNTGAYVSDGIAVYRKSGTNNYHTFTVCPSGVSSISLNANTKVIGSYAFHGCSKLTGVNMNDGVTTIEMCAFIECSVIEVMRIPGSLTSIATNAIYNCKKLQTIIYCSNNDIITYDGDPFPTNPSIYIMESFPRDPDTCSFCGHVCKPILDLQCNIPTSYFTSIGAPTTISVFHICVSGLLYLSSS